MGAHHSKSIVFTSVLRRYSRALTPSSSRLSIGSFVPPSAAMPSFATLSHLTPHVPLDQHCRFCSCFVDAFTVETCTSRRPSWNLVASLCNRLSCFFRALVLISESNYGNDFKYLPSYSSSFSASIPTPVSCPCQFFAYIVSAENVDRLDLHPSHLLCGQGLRRSIILTMRRRRAAHRAVRSG